MSFTYIRPIPTAEEIKKEIPLNQKALEIKAERDRCIRDVFEGRCNKKIIIIDIRLMKHPFIAFSCGSWFVCINSWYQNQFFGYLFI